MQSSREGEVASPEGLQLAPAARFLLLPCSDTAATPFTLICKEPESSFTWISAVFTFICFFTTK